MRADVVAQHRLRFVMASIMTAMTLSMRAMVICVQATNAVILVNVPLDAVTVVPAVKTSTVAKADAFLYALASNVLRVECVIQPTDCVMIPAKA